jgi:hypothetical protein
MFNSSFPRRRESNLTPNGCPIKDFGHDEKAAPGIAAGVIFIPILSVVKSLY